jgi:pimeloyl-ACP methyl ester carboxylesterase
VRSGVRRSASGSCPTRAWTAAPPVVREDTRLVTRALQPQALLDAEHALRQFDRPVLIVWAVDDKLFPVRDAERLAEVFPNARLERVSASRTFVMVDQPDRLADLVASFAPAAHA